MDPLTADSSFAFMQAKQNAALQKAKRFESQMIVQRDIARNTNSLSPEQLRVIDKTAKDFEAMFITELIRPMFDTIEVNSMFGGGKGEEVFTGVLLEEYGKSMAKAGGIGLADDVRKQMIEIQQKGVSQK